MGYEFFNDIEIIETDDNVTVEIETYEVVGRGGHKRENTSYVYNLHEWDRYADYLPDSVQIALWLLYVASEMPNDTIARRVSLKAYEYMNL